MQQGHLSTFTVQNYRLSTSDIRTTVPSPGGFPFSVAQDLNNPKGFFSTDVLTGAAISIMNADGSFKISAGKIAPQAAVRYRKPDAWFAIL